MADRPKLCPDDRCEPIMSDFNGAHFDKGYSFNCVGKLSSLHEFRWRDITHINSHSHCIYTPLKGISRFLITPEDAFGTYVMMANLLKVARPLQCSECGDSDRIGQSYLKAGGKTYCSRCSLRLGIWYWNGQRYIFRGESD